MHHLVAHIETVTPNPNLKKNAAPDDDENQMKNYANYIQRWSVWLLRQPPFEQAQEEAWRPAPPSDYPPTFPLDILHCLLAAAAAVDAGFGTAMAAAAAAVVLLLLLLPMTMMTAVSPRKNSFFRHDDGSGKTWDDPRQW